MYTILVADDERSMVEFLEIMLTREGYEVVTAATAEEAMDKLGEISADLVISDLSMPKAGGMAVLDRAMRLDRELPVVMVTAYASADTAVEAMKKGAYDYITKPFKIDEIKLIVAKALERRRDRTELAELKAATAVPPHRLENLLGRSEKMQALFALIRKVAPSRSTILVCGESGTGKELVARAIHTLSERTTGQFHAVNCGALPEQLLESELFGHQKGAFTGAYADKKGLMELSDGGTLFLDEVGEAPLSVQVKLLRVLQEQEFKRVGGVKDIRVDIRLIAATNQNLEELIEEGRFREDFFYRLNIINLAIPPLRQRREDIPILVNRFIEKYAKANERTVAGVEPEALRLLERCHWRGNVRELENVIERAVVLTPGDIIGVDSLPDEIRSLPERTPTTPTEIPEGGIDMETMVSDMEKDLLMRAMEKAHGVKKEAARLLNLSFRSFRYKLAKYGLSGPGKGEGDDDDR
jgi:two-component system response regulator PilR (NtrC family)